MGQYIQQGERTLLETVVRFAADPDQLTVPHDDVNGDGLNFLEGKTMDFINRQAMDGTLLAPVSYTHLWAATMVSGTVDIPTASAPSTRAARTSAGVSNCGPGKYI